MITFGGTDPRNLTTAVIETISQLEFLKPLEIFVILGPGNKNIKQISELIESINLTNQSKITMISDVPRISEWMLRADIAITSNGRTVFEIAACGTPMITISQNKRETLHTFSQRCKGAIDLGYSPEFPKSSFVDTIQKLIQDESLREQMKQELSEYNLTSGTERVISEITRLYKNREI